MDALDPPPTTASAAERRGTDQPDTSALLAAWAVAGAPVTELHRSTRDYSIKKTTATTVDRVEGDRIVLATGASYYLSEATDIEPVTYLRDDPANTARYYMLVGPDHPAARR